jgi:hypothetical protein
MVEAPHHLSRAISPSSQSTALNSVYKKVVCDNNLMIIASDKHLGLVDIDQRKLEGMEEQT